MISDQLTTKSFDDLRPRTREERRQTLLSIYAHMSSTATAYQSIVISLNVMLITAVVFLTGYLLSASAKHSGLPHELFAVVPAVLAGLGVFVTIVVRRHYFAIAGVIRRIDDVNGVFDEGLYISNNTLYPLRWRDLGSKNWRDIIFDIFIPAQTIVGLVCCVLVAIR